MRTRLKTEIKTSFMYTLRTTHKTALRTTETPHERCGFTAVEQVNRDNVKVTNAVHSSFVQGQDRLAFPFTDKWQAEWKGAAAWGDGSLSRPTLALIFLPTDISLPRRRKYVKLRGYVDYNISDVPVWRNGDFDRPISTFKQHTAQHQQSLSLWCEQTVQKYATIRITHGCGSSK